jgi:DNA-binding MarR family transcriptional regulator
MARPRPRAVDPTTDLGLLSLVVASGVTERIAERVADAGFPDVRDAHGFVVQGLLAGDTTTTQLAARLGVSAQAVSKTVAELERSGYLARGVDAGDRRARPLTLTPRGEELVDASRRARLSVARDLERWLGTRDTAELVRLLQHAAERYGGIEQLSTRRLRPRA